MPRHPTLEECMYGSLGDLAVAFEEAARRFPLFTVTVMRETPEGRVNGHSIDDWPMASADVNEYHAQEQLRQLAVAAGPILDELGAEPADDPLWRWLDVIVTMVKHPYTGCGTFNLVADVFRSSQLACAAMYERKEFYESVFEKMAEAEATPE